MGGTTLRWWRSVPAHKGDFAVCPPSPKRKSETHFLEGKVVPPFWTADAPPPPAPKWLRGPHDEAAHPSRCQGAVAEAVLWRSDCRGRRFGSHGGGVG